LYFVVNF